MYSVVCERYGAPIVALPGVAFNGTVALKVKGTEMTPEVAVGKALVEMFDSESPMVGAWSFLER